MGVRKATRALYEVICSQCEWIMDVEPSLYMAMGVNYGVITCAHCQTYLHAEIYPDIGGRKMVSQPFSDFVNATKRDREAKA